MGGGREKHGVAAVDLLHAGIEHAHRRCASTAVGALSAMFRNRKCSRCGEPIRVSEPAVMVDEPIVALHDDSAESSHIWMYFHEACYEEATAADADARWTGAAPPPPRC